jgi:hypothetical protein
LLQLLEAAGRRRHGRTAQPQPMQFGWHHPSLEQRAAAPPHSPNPRARPDTALSDPPHRWHPNLRRGWRVLTMPTLAVRPPAPVRSACIPSARSHTHTHTHTHSHTGIQYRCFTESTEPQQPATRQMDPTWKTQVAASVPGAAIQTHSTPVQLVVTASPGTRCRR